jgi:sialic acid synthase SpsE
LNSATNNFTVAEKSHNQKNMLVIAELGTSHSGDLVKAKEMIAAAATAGADCVKTQIVYADEILHPNTGYVPLPGGDVRLYDVFKKLESPPDFFAELKWYAESKGVLFLATPFGPKSAACLRELSPAMVKIASPELNYVQLLDEVSRWDIPVLLSCGVSKLSDIETALYYFKQSLVRDRVCLLHCVTAYPAPESEYNMRVIGNLSGIFGTPCGVSDHSLDPQMIPVLAVACGACVVEKHFCLSRSDPGLDDPIALPPDDFAAMCAAVRHAQTKESAEIIADLARERGAAAVEAALGDGIKQLAPSEAANYERTNRSIHALCDIAAGEMLTKKNTAILRTEKKLRPGLAPCRWDKIIGRLAKKNIPAGEGVRFQDL